LTVRITGDRTGADGSAREYVLRMQEKTKPLLMVWAVFCGLLPAAAVRAQQIDESKATKVKAAYLYNFAKFIDWPGNALGEQTMPFVIGVLDDEAFARSLDATVRGKSVANRAVNIRRLGWVKREDRAKLSECHVLYVGRSVRHRLGDVLTMLEEQPVLVVSDIRSFATEGGMIGFVLEQGRIVFEINRDALHRGKLKASAKLLKLARVVESRATAGRQ